VRRTSPDSNDGAYTAALDALDELASVPDGPARDPATCEIVTRARFFAIARSLSAGYRVAAGYASRKRIPEAQRAAVRERLFEARVRVERCLEATIEHHVLSGEWPIRELTARSVLGFCKKQGVSMRLSLSTCVPTKLCGGRCYAHDGRERVTPTILSGCYNTVVSRLWERGLIPNAALVPHIRRAVDLARRDQGFARDEYGYARRPRIRLAHVGELAAFPRYANWLAARIAEESRGEVDAVLYTRHPGVKDLDTGKMVVNLTLDRSSRKRRAWAHAGVRVVWSAWDGDLEKEVEINFLEHHENDVHSVPKGYGPVCPVTSAKEQERFCDAYRCCRCFNPVGSTTGRRIESASLEPSVIRAGGLRVRHVGLLAVTGPNSAKRRD
jgi:hypothetical protein